MEKELLEEFQTIATTGSLPDLGHSALDRVGSFDDDHDEAKEHDSHLERVDPDGGLHAPDDGVDRADGASAH